jgi:hypothetical protein
METFNDNLTPDQLKMLTLQFMGQHLTGELKELDKNLISKTNTLRGMEINPEAIIRSIPTPLSQPPHQPTPELSQPSVPVTPPGAINLPYIVPPTSEQQPIEDKDQLEFSFETSPLSERIFDSLERIEKKLTRIEERLSELEELKKKD